MYYKIVIMQSQLRLKRKKIDHLQRALKRDQKYRIEHSECTNTQTKHHWISAVHAHSAYLRREAEIRLTWYSLVPTGYVYLFPVNRRNNVGASQIYMQRIFT